MDLNAYLALNRILKQDFACSLGITRQHLHRILNKTFCSKKLALKIEDMTNGKVTRFDVKPALRKAKKPLTKIKIKQLDAFKDLK